MTMSLIQTATVGAGGAASIDFNSIPGTYTDLMIVASLRDTTAASAYEDLAFRFNSATTNYSGRMLRGNGSAASSITASGSNTSIRASWGIPASTATANTFGNSLIYIPNYAGSANKFVLVDSVSETNATATGQVIGSYQWANTTAISSIQLISTGALLAQYSTASLYGITKGSGGATVS